MPGRTRTDRAASPTGRRSEPERTPRRDGTPALQGFRPVGVTGLEPVTSSVSGKRSSRLSYTPGGVTLAAATSWPPSHPEPAGGFCSGRITPTARTTRNPRPKSIQSPGPGPVREDPAPRPHSATANPHDGDAAEDGEDPSGAFPVGGDEDAGDCEDDSEGDGDPAPSDGAATGVPAGHGTGGDRPAVVPPDEQARRSAQDRRDEEDGSEDDRPPRGRRFGRRRWWAGAAERGALVVAGVGADGAGGAHVTSMPHQLSRTVPACGCPRCPRFRGVRSGASGGRRSRSSEAAPGIESVDTAVHAFRGRMRLVGAAVLNSPPEVHAVGVGARRTAAPAVVQMASPASRNG